MKIIRRIKPVSVRRLGRSPSAGAISLVLVMLVMMSIVTAVAISNWVNVQRRGDLQMRMAVKESTLAQNAIQEARYALSTGGGFVCGAGPQEFTYWVDGSTVAVRTDCIPFP